MHNAYLHFERFEAQCHYAPTVSVREGCFEIAGARFFHNNLKSRKRVKAFVDESVSMCLAAVVLSERGNYLCTAWNQDHMGLDVIKPGFTFPEECFSVRF